MRTAQALGIKCVAVFSEADRNSMHVKMVRVPLRNQERSTDPAANRRTRRTSSGLLLRARATFARTRSLRSAVSAELRYVRFF